MKQAEDKWSRVNMEKLEEEKGVEYVIKEFQLLEKEHGDVGMKKLLDACYDDNIIPNPPKREWLTNRQRIICIEKNVDILVEQFVEIHRRSFPEKYR